MNITIINPGGRVSVHNVKTAPTTLNGVLAEIDPFLESINRRDVTECVRYLVLAPGSHVGLVKKGSRDGLESFRSLGGLGQVQSRLAVTDRSSNRVWENSNSVRAFSDVQLVPPPLHPTIFAYRSTSHLAKLVDILRLAGVDVDIRGKNGNGDTPLLSAARAIGDVQQQMNGSRTVRSTLAVRMGYLRQVFDALLHAGANVHATGACDAPPLHIAAESGCVWMVKRLLEFRADPNFCVRGYTPLHVVVSASYTFIHIINKATFQSSSSLG